MTISRPIQTLALFLISLPASGLRADPANVDRHKFVPAAPPATIVQRDGDDLEYTVEKLADITFNSGVAGIYAGKLYMEQVKQAARYPVSCEAQLTTLLFFDSVAMPIKDKNGTTLAEFDIHDRLHIKDRKKFNQINLCEKGSGKTNKASILAATGFVLLLEDILEKKPAANPEAERVFDTYIGNDIMTRAKHLPACNDDLVRAIAEVGDLYRRRSSSDLVQQRDRVIHRLAEKPFEEGGECNINYRPLPQSVLKLGPPLP